MVSKSWRGSPERLDRVVPQLGLARSRSQAAELISGGHVRVDGVAASKSGQRVSAGSSIEIDELDHYVSRAAHKLIAGLDLFGVDPAGLLALDVGASTGGFTQVLLERGAREVLAIDVGHGQLAPEMLTDARVRAVEGLNAREVTPALLAERTGIPEAPQLVVADISFISLDLVLPAVVSTVAPGAQFVLLIKPQFEVGRTGVNGGIVIDLELAVAAVARVIRNAEGLGLACVALAASPITGEHGNREVLAHFTLVPRAEPRAEPGSERVSGEGSARATAVPGLRPDGRSSGQSGNPTEWNERIREVLKAGGAL